MSFSSIATADDGAGAEANQVRVEVAAVRQAPNNSISTAGRHHAQIGHRDRLVVPHLGDQPAPGGVSAHESTALTNRASSSIAPGNRRLFSLWT